MRLVIQDETVVAALLDADAHVDISVPAPDWAHGMSAEEILARARVVEGAVIDVETLETIHVDSSGFRHASPGDGRQPVECGWHDPLVRAANGTWLCLAPLDRAKADKREAINARRDTIIAGGYRHNFGSTAGIRTLDQRGAEDAINWLGLKGVADAMITSGQGADPIGIRDAADETFTASASVVASAMVAMGIWRSQVIAYAWSLKDQLDAAENEEAVAAIGTDEGWPA
ncbi:hypothetical protein Sa4125_24980 [Aureimonas sp. SA4125]|uniref:DUF4376 domain-containing protein n=1 Tax=Aureimonas sp. SA4125 TaxID=2826993 RepID=UPI001CC3D0E6|nr:hypothetical protein [Aureimonas sp. SA4125]BDA84956.1 hypothetical protein Sa4125_24980 [Aureimonas sp. SA4125]